MLRLGLEVVIVVAHVVEILFVLEVVEQKHHLQHLPQTLGRAGSGFLG